VVEILKTLKKHNWIWVLFLLAACAKDSSTGGDLNGTYSGAYEQGPGANDSTGTVRLVFIGYNFSGESQATLRPICNGNYEIVGDSINFVNLCSTPDPYLLLVGKYQIKETGDSLYLSRNLELFSLKQQ
jgi:hypothetical protein